MQHNEQPCLICERAAQARAGANAYLIHEFEHSMFVAGDHQFHRGYCLLLLKQHVRELHELESAVQSALFQELMAATRAVVQVFQPWKMNHACYGNAVPHVHWHLFPRYESDPDHLRHPWLHVEEFAAHAIDEATARELAARVRAGL